MKVILRRGIEEIEVIGSEREVHAALSVFLGNELSSPTTEQLEAPSPLPYPTRPLPQWDPQKYIDHAKMVRGFAEQKATPATCGPSWWRRWTGG